MDRLTDLDRRTVLKTMGTGVFGSTVVTGTAGASRGNDYGNGNGIGAFLNEDAEWKDRPIWDEGMADRTGESEVEVLVGALTDLDIPDDEFPGTPPGVGPFAFDPMAIRVSPGTTVTWTWVAEHHSVTSYNESADDPSDPRTTGDHGKAFDEHAHPPHSFSHTFEERGTYLYFCHPHGTPYPAYDAFLDQLGLDPIRENLFGMRGAVRVSGV